MSVVCVRVPYLSKECNRERWSSQLDLNTHKASVNECEGVVGRKGVEGGKPTAGQHERRETGTNGRHGGWQGKGQAQGKHGRGKRRAQHAWGTGTGPVCAPPRPREERTGQVLAPARSGGPRCHANAAGLCGKLHLFPLSALLQVPAELERYRYSFPAPVSCPRASLHTSPRLKQAVDAPLVQNPPKHHPCCTVNSSSHRHFQRLIPSPKPWMRILSDQVDTCSPDGDHRQLMSPSQQCSRPPPLQGLTDEPASTPGITRQETLGLFLPLDESRL